ncbi:MAG: PEP-utilizing enzyme [Acidimicrobiales bacterium]|nr:PEP-utilizing enzyme [Acidimicrobiales bacterium]
MEEKWFTDHPPSERWPHYTRANAGEVLPTPASPFGQSYGFDNCIMKGWQLGSTQTGFYELNEYRDSPPEMCGFFGGYFYINLSCIRMQAVRNPAITVEQLDLAIFGDQPDSPKYEPHPEDEKPHLQDLADAHMQFVLTASEWPELNEERRLADKERKERPNLGSLSDEELVKRLRDLQPLIENLSRNQMVSAGSSGIAPGMLAAVGEAIGDPSIPVRLLSSLGEIDSAAPSFAIWDMSRLVRDSQSISEIFDSYSDSLLDELNKSDSEEVARFLDAFNEFVYEYGSRGANEWELSSETWETDPSIALKAIDQVRSQNDDRSPVIASERLGRERENLIEEVREKLNEMGSDELTGTFEGAITAANMMIFRERSKTTLVKPLHESRMTIRELGRRYAETGILDSAEQIFMLLDEELETFIENPDSFKEMLAKRHEDWKALWDLEPPFFIRDGVVPGLSQWDRKSLGNKTSALSVGDVLTGVPGSPGSTQGKARIVLDPSNPPDLSPGDIMVAPITDPAWTPLFLAVEAVIVNVGAQISHAVIVSRELGIPCVVSVNEATALIPDGATLEIDGTSGEVTILELP